MYKSGYIRYKSGYIRYKSGYIRYRSGYIRYKSGYIRYKSWYIRYRSGYIRYTSGIRYKSGYIRYWSGYIRYKSGFIRYRSGYIRYKSGHIRYTSGYIRYKSGYIRYKSGFIRYKSGYIRYKSWYIRYKSGYIRYRSGYIRYTSGIRYKSGYIRYWSGYIRYKSGFIRYRSGYIRYKSGHIRYMSGYIRYKSGYIRYKSGYIRYRSGYIRYTSGIRYKSGYIRYWSGYIVTLHVGVHTLQVGVHTLQVGVHTLQVGVHTLQVGGTYATRRGTVIRSKSGYIRYKSGYIRYTSGYIRDKSGFIRYKSGYIRYTSGYIHYKSGYIRYTSGYIRYTSGYIRDKSGFIRYKSEYIRYTSGYIHYKSGYIRYTSGYIVTLHVVQNPTGAAAVYKHSLASVTCSDQVSVGKLSVGVSRAQMLGNCELPDLLLAMRNCEANFVLALCHNPEQDCWNHQNITTVNACAKTSLRNCFEGAVPSEVLDTMVDAVWNNLNYNVTEEYCTGDKFEGPFFPSNGGTPPCSQEYPDVLTSCETDFVQKYLANISDPTLCREFGAMTTCKLSAVDQHCNLTDDNTKLLNATWGTNYNPFCLCPNVEPTTHAPTTPRPTAPPLGRCSVNDLIRNTQQCESEFIYALCTNPDIDCLAHPELPTLENCTRDVYHDCIIGIFPDAMVEGFIANFIMTLNAAGLYCNGTTFQPADMRTSGEGEECTQQYSNDSASCVEQFIGFYLSNKSHPELCREYTKMTDCKKSALEEHCHSVHFNKLYEIRLRLSSDYNPFCQCPNQYCSKDDRNQVSFHNISYNGEGSDLLCYSYFSHNKRQENHCKYTNSDNFCDTSYSGCYNNSNTNCKHNEYSPWCVANTYLLYYNDHYYTHGYNKRVKYSTYYNGNDARCWYNSDSNC
ncbi:Hypp5666 [Branchiostoma lanceolatum]|uniref:Hypp5666 protein n=1 Tax=Branchiostoma lanceolatum TaxID=7740 RepID=A0A8J9YNL0_BRALA|nr:Hypp5666 [Branchiostoma lanceolatum]